MKKLNQTIFLYLKWIWPVAILAVAMSLMGKSGNSLFYDVIGCMMMIWIACLIYAVFAIGLSPKLRESFVRWLSGIKENDEREAHITGLVSKRTFIFMTGVLTLLLFLSVAHVDIFRNKIPSEDGQRHGQVSVGMGLSFWPASESGIIDQTQREYIFKFHGLPFGSDGTLILIMLLQIGAFYFFSKKTSDPHL